MCFFFSFFSFFKLDAHFLRGLPLLDNITHNLFCIFPVFTVWICFIVSVGTYETGIKP